MSRLHVLQETELTPKQKRRQELEDHWDHYWNNVLVSHKNVESERDFMLAHIPIEGQRIADLGCGAGAMAVALAKYGADVTAIDVSASALCRIPREIETIQAALPYLPLLGDSYDVVICLDVIAEIEQHLQRLTLSELARILKPGGYCICSTPLDRRSHNPHGMFLDLLKTEFDIVEVKKHFSLSQKIFCLTRTPKGMTVIARKPFLEYNRLSAGDLME